MRAGIQASLSVIQICTLSPRFLFRFVLLETQKSFEFKGLIETPLFPLFVRKIGVENSLLDYDERGIEKGLTWRISPFNVPLQLAMQYQVAGVAENEQAGF